MGTTTERADIFLKKEPNKRHWYVLYVKSRHEIVANEALKEEGYKTYLPLKKELKIWSQRKKWVDEPVFKSYIFINIFKNELYAATQIQNVVTYIRFAGEPAIISEKNLLFIKKMITNQTSFELLKGMIKVGKDITIKTGPFKGMEGKITELRGKKKFVVELTSLGLLLVLKTEDIIPQ